ncbi:uncharacterized protein B0J16DRAFT_55315 [Fusarium flagelliforme]|uniref:uncharacterized protein n=1 Tax=Fusarium flagelliforme TaxID=2675880 RepID=UPI001E8D49F0|nr:uncharacterized protein B0J16DRAFT_55315 [Fusarium flagelliforme]KAH7192178.1 hypothetical protein B0J16DRAFT_55315 [Fusarium flagelliforme]
MSDHQSQPQIQDESTEQSFVDSDYSFNVPGADFGGFALSPVTSQEDVDQWLHVSSWFRDAASLGSMNQDGVLESVPQSLDEFSFSAPMIGMDLHPNNIDSTQFAFPSSPVSFLDLLDTPYEMLQGQASLSGPSDTAAAL